MGGNYRGRDPADEPERGSQPRRQGPSARRPRRTDDRDRPRPADRARGARGARPDRQPQLAAASGSRSSSSWATTAPTSSRSAAIRGRLAGRCSRSRSRPTASRSATTASTASGARPTSPSPSPRRRSCAVDRGDRSDRRRGRRPTALGARPRARGRRERATGPSGRAEAPMPAPSNGPRPDGKDEPPAGRGRGALPGAAPRVRRRGRGRVSRLGARHDGGRQRPRAVQPRRSSGRVADLRLLVNEGPGPNERYVAAGVPWFATLFGRDAIISAIQSLAFRPQLAVETLSVLAAYQATEIDDWRDAEPGKILHELRAARWPTAGELPHTPYYGSVDSTPLWLILLGATFDWTGDRALLDRLWPNAMAALEWIDRYGDRGRGRVRRVRAPLRARPPEPGLEGLERRDPGPGRDRGPAADRARRGPGLRLRREAADGRPRARPRRDRAGDPPRHRGRRSAAPVRGGVLGRGPGLLRARARSATSGRPTRSGRTRASACGPGSSPQIG